MKLDFKELYRNSVGKENVQPQALQIINFLENKLKEVMDTTWAIAEDQYSEIKDFYKDHKETWRGDK